MGEDVADVPHARVVVMAVAVLVGVPVGVLVDMARARGRDGIVLAWLS